MAERLTDNEIIKALTESVAVHAFPFYCFNEDGDRVDVHVTDVISLINRQQAEIERLEKENRRAVGNSVRLIVARESARAEAIKEFAERLVRYPDARDRKGFVVYGEDLHNLVKEMVGDTDG